MTVHVHTFSGFVDEAKRYLKQPALDAFMVAPGALSPAAHRSAAFALLTCDKPSRVVLIPEGHPEVQAGPESMPILDNAMIVAFGPGWRVSVWGETIQPDKTAAQVTPKAVEVSAYIAAADFAPKAEEAFTVEALKKAHKIALENTVQPMLLTKDVAARLGVKPEDWDSATAIEGSDRKAFYRLGEDT